ncbi:MAG: NAD-binding protein [Rhizobiales bacterium]|nr:NAD-binding protein [Hyphomicrobiales bacterium]
MRIGFVGLGLMGLPMAENLIAAGNELIVCSNNIPAIKTMRGLGARIASGVAEMAGEVEFFCACRVTPAQSLEVFLGPDGVVSHGRPGLVCIDFSTIDPETSRRIAGRLAERGIGHLDAPISGGPTAAANRTLSVIVGGADAHFIAARPLLESLAKAVFHMGPPGAGVTTKLCNNMVTITTHALLAEMATLAKAAGIDGERLYEVLSASSASSRTLARVFPGHFLPRDFKAAASMTTIIKDLECAIAAADALGVPHRIASTALERFHEAAANGLADMDISAVVLDVEKEASTLRGSRDNRSEC